MRRPVTWSALIFAVAVFVVVTGAGCGPALPSTSFIDKLRLLAVQAEPPEISPGQATTLTLLAVEPVVPGAEVHPPATPSPLTEFWLACPEPAAVTTSSFAPCGFGQSDLSFSAPPTCQDAPDAPLCIAGTTPTISYTAPADALAYGSNGSATILFTVVVADTPDGAIGCLEGAAQTGAPANPDHCVIAFKELTVSDPATHPLATRNHNPQLTAFDLELQKDGADGGTIHQGDGGVAQEAAPVDLVAGGGFVPLRDKYSPSLQLSATSAIGASEVEADGTYEVLTLSWYTTSGSFDDSRSVFIPPHCSDPTLCPTSSPLPTTTSPYDAPYAADLAASTDASHTVHYWAVVRDDRGGVGWLTGSAVAR